MRSHAMVLGVALVAAVACEPRDRLLSVDATGIVVGTAFLDANGNGVRDPGEAPVPGIRVSLTMRGTPRPLASVVSGADGQHRFARVPVGDYTVSVDPASVGDTVRVTRVEADAVRVQSGDTVAIMIAVSYPNVTVAEARSLPAGRRVFVEGIALNDRTAFADGSVHVADEAVALRLTGLRPEPLTQGTFARFRGVTDRRDGQPTLDDVTVFVLDSMAPPDPVSLQTGEAATARDGSLDAMLVHVPHATVTSALVSGLGTRFYLDDGSGAIEGVVGANRGFDSSLFVPGTELSVTGLLVPEPGANRWRLRPRSDDDISLGYRKVTVAAARALPPGETVLVVGIALNSRDAFADTTVHVTDGTGAIRGTRVAPGTLLAGDRARFVGTTGRRDGQPTLDGVTPFVLEVGPVPASVRLTTAVAATAGNGVFDAALVQVRRAAILDTTTVAGLLLMNVDDGSGPVEVAVRTDGNFDLAELTPATLIDATGLLIPEAGGSGSSWRLRPRTRSDLSPTTD